MRHVGGSNLYKLARRMLLGMTLMLFFIHAALPVGFMPDLSALSDGQIKIVVCTDSGYQTVVLDEAGNPVKPSKNDDPAKTPQCQFNTSGSKVFVQQVPTLTTAISFQNNASEFYPREFGLNRVTPGAPVGLRAPPFILV